MLLPRPRRSGFRVLSLLPLLLAGFGPAAPRLAALPAHPTVLLTDYKNAQRPVLRAVATDAVVAIDGKETRVRTDTRFFAERAPYFGPGFVTFSAVSYSGQGLRIVTDPDVNPDPGGPLAAGNSLFEATVTPTAEIRGGFVAIVVFDALFLENETVAPRPEILIRELPPLPAGVATPVKFTTKLSAHFRRAAFFPLVFATGGAEVRSNLGLNSSRYFSRVERLKLAAVIETFCRENPAATQAAKPVLRLQPELRDGADYGGQTVAATATVSARGFVESVDLPAGLDRELGLAIRSAVSGWLFLPALRDGVAQPSRVQIPFKF